MNVLTGSKIIIGTYDDRACTFDTDDLDGGAGDQSTCSGVWVMSPRSRASDSLDGNTFGLLTGTGGRKHGDLLWLRLHGVTQVVIVHVQRADGSAEPR